MEMNQKSFCIFVVDDDPLMRMVLTNHLQGFNYEVHDFSNGPDCFAALDLSPNLILLDIDMPEQSGLELCKKIREIHYDDIQIIFITAHTNMDILLQVFKVGGDDFIPKNSPKEIIRQKVETAIDAEIRKQELRQQLSFAQHTAYTAMSSLGETGIVLEFLRASFSCTSLDDISEQLLSVFQSFDSHGLLWLYTDKHNHFGRTEGLSTEVSKSILMYAQSMGRIVMKDDRLIMNYPHITLMLIDLDTNDQDKIGRIRDHMAIIVEGAGVRITALEAEQRRIDEANNRINAIRELSLVLADVEKNQNKNRIQIEDISEHYKLITNEAFIGLGLTDSQESLLRDISENQYKDLQAIFHADTKLAIKLSEIIEQQRKLIA